MYECMCGCVVNRCWSTENADFFYPSCNCKCFLFACVRPAGNRGSVSGGSEHAEAADWYLVSAVMIYVLRTFDRLLTPRW